jgi:excisionase family DNA binding protein
VADHDRPGGALQLYTAAQAAQLLQVSPSWLRRKAAARAIACTFIGKHLRFSTADLKSIIAAGASTTAAHQRKR